MKSEHLRLLPVFILLSACAKTDRPAGRFDAVNAELLASVPETIYANEMLTFRPAEKHHFEMKAPQKCGNFPFELRTPRVMRCQVTDPGTHLIELSVCDDQRTYCKFVKFEVEATASKGFFAAGGPKKAVLQPPKHEHPPLPGFLLNEPDKALAEAKAGGKLLFIDFYGIWCPPCNMLEEYVYTKPPFLDATKDMVRVMMDADSDLSWEWKAHFKAGGYPTVVIANEKLEEIARIVGYRPMGAMISAVRAAEAQRGEPIEAVLAKYGEKGPAAAPAAARKRIGTWHYDRGEYGKAVEWLNGHPDAEARKTGYLAARGRADQESDDKAGLEAARSLAREFPGDVAYAGWVEYLLGKKETDAKKLVQPALDGLQRWRKSPKLAETGYTLADLSWQEADLHQAAGDEAAAKAAYLKTADLYEEMAGRSSLKLARGANLERAYCLHKAGKNAEAKALYEQLAEAYKDEFTFNYNYASALHELGEFPKAYDYVRRAEANAYGDNWLRAVHLKAKLELKMGEKAKARDSLQRALQEAVVPRSTAVRTHSYVARLRKLLKETEAAN